jgi:hypothetical protein
MGPLKNIIVLLRFIPYNNLSPTRHPSRVYFGVCPSGEVPPNGPVARHNRAVRICQHARIKYTVELEELIRLFANKLQPALPLL